MSIGDFRNPNSNLHRLGETVRSNNGSRNSRSFFHKPISIGLDWQVVWRFFVTLLVESFDEVDLN